MDLTEDTLRQILREEIQATIQEFQNTSALHGDKIGGKYLSRHEVSEFLGIGLSTVDLWVRTGRLSKIKMGRLVRFDRDEIEANLSQLSKYARTQATGEYN